MCALYRKLSPTAAHVLLGAGGGCVLLQRTRTRIIRAANENLRMKREKEVNRMTAYVGTEVVVFKVFSP